jgi:hypothetical protein
MRRLSLGAAFTIAASLAPGCKCSSEKPYTPFGVASALPEAAAPASPSASAAPTSSAPGFAPRKAELAPGGVRTWNLGGRSIEAPASRRFDQAIVSDFDGDGENEIVAWLLADPNAPASKPIAPAELWLFPTGADSRVLLPLPTFVPTGPGCKLTTRLEQTGPHSVTLDVSARCEARLIPRSPTRAVVTLAPLAEEPIIQLLRLADPAPGETLSLSVVSDDRDSDGRDDANVRVDLATTGKPVSADLVWLDRAAGASRDPNEPTRSLARSASREALRAKQKKTAPEVVARVALLRRLAFTLCAESATPRLFDRDGAALHCGGLGAFVDSLATAEIQAELAQGHVLQAFSAHSRDGWYLGTLSAKIKTTLERELTAAVTRRKALLTPVAATPLTPAEPHFSALAFEPDGTLVVQTPGGAVKFGADGSAIPIGEGQERPPARALDVSAGGVRWFMLTPSCDRSEITLGLSGAPELVTNVLSPRPGACTKRFDIFPKPTPLGFAPGKLEALVAGTPVGEAGALPSAGSPRSADGRFIVTPTRLGLLLASEGEPKSELWELAADAAPKLTELADCVLAADASRAACVAGTRAYLVKPE